MDALEKFTRVFNKSGVVWTNEMWDAWRELDEAFQAVKPVDKLDILSPADMKRAKNTPWHDKSSY